MTRVHIKHPCQGWINKDEIIVGQIAIINSLVGATVREDIEIDSPIVGELPYESRVFITEQDETKDGKPRACVFAPLQGWVSVKCLAPICDRMGDVLAAGKKVLEPTDVEGKNVVFSHYIEINHEMMCVSLSLVRVGATRRLSGHASRPKPRMRSRVPPSARPEVGSNLSSTGCS